MITKDLAAFLRDWLGWAIMEGEDKYPYFRGSGLCVNTSYHRASDSADIRCQLVFQLKKDGLDQSYPFGGPEVYFNERDDKTAYLNPKRRAWVVAKLEEFDAYQ